MGHFNMKKISGENSGENEKNEKKCFTSIYKKISGESMSDVSLRRKIAHHLLYFEALCTYETNGKRQCVVRHEIN